jgi:hypothetical protein
MTRTTASKTPTDSKRCMPAVKAPKAPRQPKPEPVTLDLAQLVERVGANGTIFHRVCDGFDHPGYALTAYQILLTDGPAARLLSINAYNGVVSPKLLPLLELQGGVEVRDVQATIQRLLRKGYSVLAVAKPDRKTRRRKVD